MENYHESYRTESLPLLEKTITQLTQTMVKPEDAVNIDIQRKK